MGGASSGGTRNGGATSTGTGGDTGGAGENNGAQAGTGQTEFDPQLPPLNAAGAELWLQQKFYEAWACEEQPNAKTDGAAAIHVHGDKTRVCSNDLLAASSPEAEFPEGVASVKEVYDGDGKLAVTVLSVKGHADSDGGQGWFWYEPPSLAGFGVAACTGCHQAAGSDADHPGAGDFVYFKN